MGMKERKKERNGDECATCFAFERADTKKLFGKV
jgi:nitrate/TMAO reductase-like tetraheme cytochrome c subunit